MRVNIAQSRTELSSAPPDQSDCVSWLEYRVVQADQRVGHGGLKLARCRAWRPLQASVLHRFEELRGLKLPWLPLKGGTY